jgi:hypothetical protein
LISAQNANGLQSLCTDDDDDDDTPRKTNRYIVALTRLSPSAKKRLAWILSCGYFLNEAATKTHRRRHQLSPSMAMVVVKDPNSGCVETVPPVLQNLFADSEKRILKALDRGLEDFVAGKVKFTSARPDPQTEETQSAQEAMLAEIMDEDDEMNESKAGRSLPNDVMDADIVVKTEKKEEQARAKKDDASLSARREAALKSMNQNTATDGVKVEEEIQGKGLDFAVQAAKRAAAKRQTNKEDFAVAAAAKKVAASSKRSKSVELEAVDTAPPAKTLTL